MMIITGWAEECDTNLLSFARTCTPIFWYFGRSNGDRSCRPAALMNGCAPTLYIKGAGGNVSEDCRVKGVDWISRGRRKAIPNRFPADQIGCDISRLL